MTHPGGTSICIWAANPSLNEIHATYDLQMSALNGYLLWSLMEAVCYSAIAGWDASERFFWCCGLDKYPPKIYALMDWVTRVALLGAEVGPGGRPLCHWGLP